MANRFHTSDAKDVSAISPNTTKVLGPELERSLLQELSDCKAKLAEALAKLRETEPPSPSDDAQAVALSISSALLAAGPEGARLGVIYRKYSQLREELALSNMRLVAHIAKRFCDRGVPYSDLIQDGFCGLLEAIDRFDLKHETKLATYATWWIRHSIQRSVASAAYPVRLTPRHLRKLARNQEAAERAAPGKSKRMLATEGKGTECEMIQRILTATRPAVSLDATLDHESSFSLKQSVGDPREDRSDAMDTREAVDRLVVALPPREQQILSLRFGLGGGDRLSLSQVGKVFNMSKERVRQIQDRAMGKLRSLAAEQRLLEKCNLSD